MAEQPITLNKDFVHNARNSLLGMYYERKCLLKHALGVAEALESRFRFRRKAKADRELRKMMACMRNMDRHLNRLHNALYPKKEDKE